MTRTLRRSRLTLLGTTTLVGALALSACSSTEEKKDSAAGTDVKTVAVKDNFGTQQVPVDPQRVVALDNRSFEVLDQWKVPVVAVPKPIVPKTVPGLKNNDELTDIGGHKEPNLEAIAAANPDLIVNGQRFAQHRDKIIELNPNVAIVELEPAKDKPLADELKRHITELGKAFGKEKEADALIDDFNDAAQEAREAYQAAGSPTVMALNVTGGKTRYIAPGGGRSLGALFDIVGLKPALEVEGSSSNHKGDDVSVEAIAQANPEWLLVMDRDAAISASDKPEYRPASRVIEETEALADVTAVSSGQIVYAPNDTYVNESIITYTEILRDLAKALTAATKGEKIEEAKESAAEVAKDVKESAAEMAKDVKDGAKGAVEGAVEGAKEATN